MSPQRQLPVDSMAGLQLGSGLLNETWARKSCRARKYVRELVTILFERKRSGRLCSSQSPGGGGPFPFTRPGKPVGVFDRLYGARIAVRDR